MSTNSKIEWTDHTFNPWIGCSKISTSKTCGGGCDGCYAEFSTPVRVLRAKGIETWGPHAARHRTSPANWAMPLRWNAQAEAFAAEHSRRQRVFCASLADVFDNAVPVQWRIELVRLIMSTPNLDWLLLTKRIGNAAEMLEVAFRGHTAQREGWRDNVPPNVWIGATVVNQAEADRDIPKLLAVPASKRFLSMEPLLGPVDLSHIDIDGHSEIFPLAGTGGCEDYDGNAAPDLPALDWVIVGGESGPSARPMHPDWARSLRDQCATAGVPFLFKQWGEWFPVSQQAEGFTHRLYRSNRKARPHEDQGALDDCYGRTCLVEQAVIHEDGSVLAPLAPMAFLQGTGAMLTFKAGKKAAGRALDGREWNEVPHGAA
jgi:protein gp37